MNRFRPLLFTSFLIAVPLSPLSAAELWLERQPTASGISYSLYLDGTGVGLFNTIGVRITPTAPSEFLNYDSDGIDDTEPAAAYEAGDDRTFINAKLFMDRAEGGLGYAGAFDPSNGTELIDFATGPLGQ